MRGRRRPAAGLRLLIASDGSPGALAAVEAAVRAPWPVGTRAAGVVAAAPPAGADGAAWLALHAAARRVVADTQRRLRRRWRGARVALIARPAVDAILARARAERADVIVVGTGGQGRVGVFLLGSVSRAVMRAAATSVLVVRGRGTVRRVLVGVDGSSHARRAARLVARLVAGGGRRVRVVQAVEPSRLPSLMLLPASARRTLSAEAAAMERAALARAGRNVQAAAAVLRGAGWRVDAVVRRGAPVPELLRAAAAFRADLVVLGARGVSGLERLLLGSVAEEVLATARASVLLVR